MGQEYFGEPWPSAICADGTQIPTPVGAECLWCEEKVVEGDQGTLMTTMKLGEDQKSVAPETRPIHKECSLRQVLGPLAHLQQKCSCFGGDKHDDPNKTARQNAIDVWSFIMATKKR